MLPKASRVVTAQDFRRIVRRGRRMRCAVAVLHVVDAEGDRSRFGFVVSRKVGGAVVRNRVRRRMSAIVAAELPSMRPMDVVVRALPPAATADFATLSAEITPLLRSR